MSVLRPLPPRPNLEFEHKEAKALLRRLRAGDPDALARARERHPAIDTSAPDRIRLADAQLVIAREYGFMSWPRLVQYFGASERLRYATHSIQSRSPDFYETFVRSLVAEHGNRRNSAGRALAAYVPRFYGWHLDEVFASTITEDDARLAVARQYGFPTWEALLQGITAERRTGDRKVDPMKQASDAMKDGDLARLQHLVDEHPDLLHPTDHDWVRGRSL